MNGIHECEAQLEALIALRERPAGTIRITTARHAADGILWPRLWPKLAKFLPKYPDIKVEIMIDYGLSDTVAQRLPEPAAAFARVCAVGRGAATLGSADSAGSRRCRAQRERVNARTPNTTKFAPHTTGHSDCQSDRG